MGCPPAAQLLSVPLLAGTMCKYACLGVVVSQLPVYALVVFGCYSLACIGVNLFRFRDCPEAAEELKGVSSVLSLSWALRCRKRPHTCSCFVVL